MTAAAVARAIAVTTAVAVMSGCHARRPDRAEVVPTVQPTTVPAPSHAEAYAAVRVLDAYTAMRAAEVRAYAAPAQPHRDLTRSATGQALTGIAQTLLFYRRQGIVVRGHPHIRPRVTAVDLTVRPWTATIADCFDSGGWRPALAATGQPVSVPAQRERYPVVASARMVAGRWMVDRLNADRSRPC